MLETSARLLRLLSLLQSRRFWSGGELARQLQVTERTLRRDMEKLRSLGYPVDGSSGVAGGYRLGAGAALPPLLLEDDEAVAVAIGLRTSAGGSVQGLEEAALRALAKLDQVLPSRLRRRVKALHSSIVPLHQRGPAVDPALLSALAAACRDREQARFVYGSAAGERKERLVEPHGLAHTGQRWYLVAWDVPGAGFRTFRVDRIQSKVTTGARFVPREIPFGDLATYVSRSVASEPYRYRAQVILHAPLEQIARTISPSAGTLEALDGKRCVLRTGAHSLDSLAGWIAMIGVDFEVLEPAELAARLRVLARRLNRAAGASNPRRKTRTKRGAEPMT